MSKRHPVASRPKLVTSYFAGVGITVDRGSRHVYTTKDHLAALIERYGSVADHVRAAIDETADAGDADTADLFTAFSRALDKALWFLEAHVQETE